MALLVGVEERIGLRMTSMRGVVLVLCLGLCAAGCGSEETAARPELKAELVRTLEGHAEVVWRVTFSPDGELLASCSPDKTVRLWRVADGSLQQVLAEHSSDVHTVAFSPDGAWLASSGYDKTVKLWRLETPTAGAP